MIVAVAASLASCKGEAPTALSLDPVVVGSFFCTETCAPTASGQFAAAGKAVTITLQVVDQRSRAVSGVRLSWTVQSGNGFTDATSSISDSTGVVAVTWTLDTVAKLDTLQASIAPNTTLTVTATGRPGSPAIATKISGDAQTVAAGATSQPLVVKLTDRYGNPVPNFAIAWAPAGLGALGALTTRTDSTGITRNSLTTTAGPGDYRVITTFGSVPALIFDVTAK